MSKEKVMLEEYSRIREEIYQLNGQAFAVLTGSLGFNFALLGAMYSSSRCREDLYMLPFFAFLVLAASSLLLAHKIRMAHRLGFFLKYFVQPKLEGIQWPGVYFEYRELFNQKHKGLFWPLVERFAVVQIFVLVIIQFVDFILFFRERLILVVISLIIGVLQIVLLHCFFDIKTMQKVFEEISQPTEDTPH